MTNQKARRLWLAGTVLILGLMPFSGFAVAAPDFSDAKKLCGDLTPANRAMAKSAGYDVDKMCGEITAASTMKKAVPPAPTVPRVTVSGATATETKPEAVAVAVAPVAVAGVGTPAAASTLKPFGYDLFANAPTTFAPASSIPVSADYLLGPGDTLDILFYGKTNSGFSLEINREGFVDFPELGPVGLAGMTYGEAKDMLRARIAAQIVGTKVSISMGSLRSMQIFVLGEAFKPGAYTVSSLSTITHALVTSGGISDIGSLRNVQLKRQGKVVASLDLYDLLLKGDTSNDVRVQAADVIYIPTVGDLASIEGQVLRPAIYELKGGETIKDLVALAGGMGPKAFAASATIRRIDDSGFMAVLDVDLSAPNDFKQPLKNGDHLRIGSIIDESKSVVSLEGHVYHPGQFTYTEGMRVSDLLANMGERRAGLDLNYAVITRTDPITGHLSAVPVKVGDILNDSETDADVKLQDKDVLRLFAIDEDRPTALATLVSGLRAQAKLGDSARVVVAEGRVRFPGAYPLTDDMSIKDLIGAAGGLTEEAYRQSAEIARLDLSDPERAVSFVVSARLDNSSDTNLQPGDRVQFRTIPDFQEVQTITLEGEVIFPGTYAFMKGETLTSVVQRAGGFTDEAFVDGSIFLRAGLKAREQDEIERLIQTLNQDISAENLLNANSEIEVSEAQVAAQREAITALATVEATGRMVIPLDAIMNYTAEDVVLQNGDRLLVPRISQEVTVIGEVQRPTSYLFDPEFSQADYIKQSGGFKLRADKRKIYVVKASGEVIQPKRDLLRFRSAKAQIGPGDTIVVPLDADDSRIRGIPLLAEVSTIIYQLALGSAAIKSFNNN